MTTPHRWARSGGIGVAAAASLLVALLPFAGPAQAQQTFDRGIARACPDDAPDAFADDDDNVHEDAINCVAFWEITVGLPDGSYGVRQHISRAQMATFIAKTMRTAGHEFADDPPDAFGDDDENVHEDNINALAAEGVVRGDGQGNYNPDDPVRRDQMASFINQAIGVVTGEQPSSGEDFFTDDDNSAHEANINALASIGVVTGTGAGEYSPSDFVRRDAMASFVARGADYLAEQGHWPVEQAIGVEPSAAVALDPSASGTSDSGAQQYTVDASGVDDVTIALYRAEDVQLSSDGDITVGPIAKLENGQGVSIERVNGQAKTAAAPGAGNTQEDDVEPVNGVVTFTVDSVVEDTIVPVVWHDSINPTQNVLELSDTGSHVPKEAHGVGARVSWIPNEASSGDEVGSVEESNPGLDFYTLHTGPGVGAEVTIEYDSNDAFQLGSTNPQPITMASFERVSGVGASVSVDYSSSIAGQSVHTVTTPVVTAAPWIEARRADADGDGDRDDVALFWGAAPGPGVVYDVFRSSNDTLDAGDTRIANGTSATKLADLNQQDEVDDVDRWYFVIARDPASGSQSQAVRSEQVTLPASTTEGSGAPSAASAVLSTDVFHEGVVGGSGPLQPDVWTITFEDPVNVAGNATISILEDGNPFLGGSATLTNGQNATFSLSNGNTTLTVTIPQIVTDDSDVALGYWVQMTGATGITSAETGTAWGPGGAPDANDSIGCTPPPIEDDNEPTC